MQTTIGKIPLSSVKLDDASAITRVQLLAGKQGTELLYSTTGPSVANARGYETSISSIGLGSDGHPPLRLFALSQLLPPPPSWDFAPGPQGLNSVVYEKALGATYVLLLRDSKQGEKEVTADYPFESFTKPRFIGGAEDDPTRAVTAISDEKSSVLFARGPDGRYAKRAKLCDCSLALIVRYLNDVLLFYKVTIPGAVRGNLIQPGTLRCVRLGRDFAPAGPPIEPLPGSVVFEFDVATRESTLAILATTKAGTILARGTSLKEPLRSAEFEESDNGKFATSPSVVVTGSQVGVAMLERAQTRQARVLVGSVAATE